MLSEISLAGYRDGRDSVAFHGDRVGRERDDTIVAIVSFGAPRRFLLRPAGGGPSRAFDLGWGDLLVMGGTCQRTWEHAVPKMASAAPRLSVQFRPQPTARRRRPMSGGAAVTGEGYAALSGAPTNCRTRRHASAEASANSSYFLSKKLWGAPG